MLYGGASYIISVMIYVVLVVLGLCFGSFVNAFVWRLHEQQRLADSRQPAAKKKPSANSHLLTANDLSVVKGRSMCVHCHHELAAKDLVPVLSWLWLRGRCRYCGKPISAQYPLVELLNMLLFVASYLYWPTAVSGWQTAIFALWLVLLIGLTALLVYDLRWMLLPNKIIFPLMGVAVLQAIVRVATDSQPWHALLQEVLAVIIGGGIFYVLFQVSGGRWIGGGDVKLGWLLGIIVATAEKAVLVIFLAAVLGSLVSLPLLVSRRLKRNSVIPFGPFLIVAGIVVVLFGGSIIHWYNHTFLLAA